MFTGAPLHEPKVLHEHLISYQNLRMSVRGFIPTYGHVLKTAKPVAEQELGNGSPCFLGLSSN